MHCGAVNGKGVQKGGGVNIYFYIYAHMADSFYCTVETSIALQNNLYSIKN